jgi:hypothetical protein
MKPLPADAVPEETDEKVRAIAHAFATALDQNDFDRVIFLLSPNCRFEVTNSASASERVLVGPAAIVESYRWHDARARATIDRVEYSNSIEGVHAMTAAIRFTDVLEKNGDSHTYNCRQHITVHEAAAICRIIQEDIPEEKAAVREFMKRVGVQL